MNPSSFVKRSLFCLLAFLCCGVEGWAQVSFISAADGGNNGGTTNSLTFSFTVSSGTNRLLVVPLVGDVYAGTDDITGVTYNGVSMTLLAKQVSGCATPTDRKTYAYYLLNPSSGANNVVVSSTSSHYLLAGAGEWDGVSQTGQPDVAAVTNCAGGGAVSTLTTSITTSTDNDWTILVESSYNNNPCPTAGTGATQRTCAAAFGNWGLFDSNGVIHPAGSYSMTTNRTSINNNILHIVGAFKASGGGSTPKSVIVGGGIQ